MNYDLQTVSISVNPCPILLALLSVSSLPLTIRENPRNPWFPSCKFVVNLRNLWFPSCLGAFVAQIR